MVTVCAERLASAAGGLSISAKVLDQQQHIMNQVLVAAAGVSCLALQPDVGGHVAAWVAHFVAARGTVGLLSEVDDKVRVDAHAAALGVAVDHVHLPAFVFHAWVELVVPAGE